MMIIPLLEKTVRAGIRKVIASNEQNFRYSKFAQIRYRDTDKGKAAIKRQNEKIATRNKAFSTLAYRLQQALDSY